MGLDIRWPIGLMINLIWGAVLLVFGVLMVAGAMGGQKKP